MPKGDGSVSRMGWTTKIIILCSAVGVSLAGCQVDSDDVQQWKGTVKGPTRLVAVIGSDRYARELRTEAALAIVEMDRNDIDALALLKGALDDLRGQDAAASETIVGGMIPRLEALLAQEPDAANTVPDPVQVRVKDAAYMVIPYAPEDTKEQLIRAVVGWYSADFEGRSLAGDYSAEQVTRALGPEAAGMLVDALHEKMPPQAMIKIAEIIGEDGDEETRMRAGERLIAIEKEMEKSTFVKWLAAEIRESIKASGEKVDNQRVNALALYNRENYITQGALPAMRHLGDQAAVATRLLGIADTKPGKGRWAGMGRAPQRAAGDCAQSSRGTRHSRAPQPVAFDCARFEQSDRGSRLRIRPRRGHPQPSRDPPALAPRRACRLYRGLVLVGGQAGKAPSLAGRRAGTVFGRPFDDRAVFPTITSSCGDPIRARGARGLCHADESNDTSAYIYGHSAARFATVVESCGRIALS